MHSSCVSQLAAAIEAYANDLRTHHPLLGLARSGQLGPSDVARYLMNVRFMIRHTPLHLSQARRRAAELDQLALAAFYEEKLAEESGHDVWANDDLAHLGREFAVAPPEAPSRHLQDLAHFLERLIAKEPSHYLGYVLFSEYVTVLLGPIWVRALTMQCGIPSEALSVVSRHIELDQDHVRKELEQMDALLAGSPVALFDALHRSMRCFRAFCDDLYAAALSRADAAPVAAE